MDKVNVAINGFGRIGRTALRVWLSRDDLKEKMWMTAINTSGSMEASGWAHLLKYDSNYGVFEKKIWVEEERPVKEATAENPFIGNLVVEGIKIPLLAQRDPEQIPWKKYYVKVVLESTGVFTDEVGASKHIKGGAERVLISAPSKGGKIKTHVLGVNEYSGEYPVADNASCTTNCTAPVVAVLHDKIGIVKAALTTVHGYTDDQNLQDGSHRDLRRARAAARNIIPTSTGAAIAVTKTIPDLEDKFDGVALRVPVSVGSLSDITFLAKRATTVEEVNGYLKEASASERFKGILAVTEEPIVSGDIVGRGESSIVDLILTQVIDGDLVKVFAWYDNEWGYCNRLMEQAVAVGNK